MPCEIAFLLDFICDVSSCQAAKATLTVRSGRADCKFVVPFSAFLLTPFFHPSHEKLGNSRLNVNSTLQKS